MNKELFNMLANDNNFSIEEFSKYSYKISSFGTFHLDENLSFKKFANYVITKLKTNIEPVYIKLDVESIKMLISYIEEEYSNSEALDFYKLSIIINMTDMNARKELLKYYKYDSDNLDKVVYLFDFLLYKKIVNNEGFNKDELYRFRKKFLEYCITNFKSIQKNLLASKDVLFSFDFFYKYYSSDEEEIVQGILNDMILEYFLGEDFDNDIKKCEEIKRIYLEKGVIFNEDSINFIDFIIDLKNYSYEEKIEMFQKMKNYNVREVIHKEIELFSNNSKNSIVESCTKFEKNQETYNEKLSSIYGVDVYYLNGENFYGIVRMNVKVSRKGDIPNSDEFYRLSSSFSLIGTDNIKTYKNPQEFLVLLYEGIKPTDIKHVSSKDSWSNATSTIFPDSYYTAKELLENATDYTEIIIENSEGIKPSAIVCYDTITDFDVLLAKKYSLPVVLINSKCYEKKPNINIDERNL